MRDSPPEQRPIQEAFDALLNEFRVAINHDRSLAGPRKLGLLVVGALISSMLGLGAIGFTWSKRNYHEDQGSLEALLHRGAELEYGNRASTQTASMSALPKRDLTSIKQAMAFCDAEAATNPDGLYFLVTPVTPYTFEGATSLLPSGASFGSLSLMFSHDMLSGLERGVLTITARTYDFAIIDTVAAQTTKWRASGPFKFKQEYASEVSKFQLGFDFGSNSLTWTLPFDRQKGNCYWVNVRVPALPWRGRADWAAAEMPRSFYSAFQHF